MGVEDRSHHHTRGGARIFQTRDLQRIGRTGPQNVRISKMERRNKIIKCKFAPPYTRYGICASKRANERPKCPSTEDGKWRNKIMKNNFVPSSTRWSNRLPAYKSSTVSFGRSNESQKPAPPTPGFIPTLGNFGVCCPVAN